MAETDYRRLSCATCNTTFPQPTGRGRPPKDCDPCRGKRGFRSCAGCGKAISGKKHKWCSMSCRAESLKPTSSGRCCERCGIKLPIHRYKWCSLTCRDGTKMTREQYRVHVRSKAKGKVSCMCCGKPINRQLSGTAKKKGYFNKFCSHACKSKIADVVRAEKEFLRRLADSEKSTFRGKRPKIRLLARVLMKVARLKEKASSPCLVCGKPCGSANGPVRKYCSKQCAKRTEAFKQYRRARKAARRAKQRGANGAEFINPIKVFMDAGWKCQICGKPTPQRLRGTIHKRAPELDHIVPLSKGGQHTWSNVQCACRECNGWKSDRIVVGQAGLFTGLK